MKHILLAASLAMTLLAATGCKSDHDDMKHHDMAGQSMMHPITHAIAVLEPTQGNHASGTVRFTQDGPDSVSIVADLTGLAPNSIHGFHIHEFGDLSSPDGSSAGGHFNPGHQPHGSPNSESHHAGDLGNIQANPQGNAHLEMTLHHVSVGAHPNPLLGRSVVLHANPDDLHSQPSGDAGSRIAVGVIGAAK